jgi:hypothetical protein
MSPTRILPLLLLALAPAFNWAAIGSSDLPAGARWYVHVDLERMRTTVAGKHLYGWLESEVFDDIRDEIGIDLDRETDRVTAFSASREGLTIVIDGEISQETQDKVLALAAASGGLDRFEAGKDSYYFVKGDGEDGAAGPAARFADDGYDIDPLEKGAYFSFAVPNKVIVTATGEDMQTMLANRGRIGGTTAAQAAMLVLSADQSLLQAGLDAEEFGDDVGWDSNIVRNTEQIALLIADDDGQLAITAELLAAEKEMAESLASIARGLISLQVFNDELDPEISEFLANTTVEVKDRALIVSLSLDPEAVVAAID